MTDLTHTPPKSACSTRFLVLAAIAVGLLAIMPVILVRFPSMNDYPFHMARMVILSHLNLPEFARFYHSGSFLLPNLAMDGVALTLAKIVSAESASRIFVALCLLAMLGGTALLHRAAHGRWSPWSLMGIAIVHNGIFIFGFLNYLFGIGLALAAAALWMVMRPGIRRLVVAFLCCIVLMYCHMEAFGAFGLTAGSIELYRESTRWWRERRWQPIVNLLCSALPFLAAMALFVALSPTSGVGGPLVHYPRWIGAKPYGFLFSLYSGSVLVDIVTLAALLALAGFLWLRGSLRLSKPLALAAIVMGATVMAMPSGLLGASYVDIRLGPVFALLAIATFDVSDSGDRLAIRAVCATVFALAVVRSTMVTAHWIDDNQVIAPIVAGMAPIEPGGTLFTATAESFPQVVATDAARRATWRPSTKHLGSYAVLNNPVFVPMTFANPTQQPLNIVPEYQPLKAFQGDTPIKVATAQDALAFLARIHANLHNGSWPKLDHVYALLQGPQRLAPLTLPDYVRPVTEGDRFILLRFVDPADAGGTGSQ